jgi:hypothetical protein
MLFISLSLVEMSPRHKAFDIIIIFCILTLFSLYLNFTKVETIVEVVENKSSDTRQQNYTQTYTEPTLKSRINTPLPPISWNSSWLGNQWIPSPEYRLYSPQEIKNYFSDHSVLVVGDSTARRQFATWYAIMNATSLDDVTLKEMDHASVIDVNKKIKTEPSTGGYDLSRQLPITNKSWYYYRDNCFESLVQNTLEPSFFISKNLGQFSLVVFILGPWEYGELFPCSFISNTRGNITEAFMERLTEMVDAHPNTKFVWRTWASKNAQTWKYAQAHNHFIKTLIQQFQIQRYQSNSPTWAHISYVDWGQIMGPRSFPKEKRIQGDIDHHFGFEARSTFIQMMINHLQELEKEVHHNLAPGWTLLKSNDTANDCVYAGGSEIYCLSTDQLQMAYNSFLTLSQPDVELSQQEAEDYEWAKSHFCPDCTWNGNVKCGIRLHYFQGHYNLSEAKALAAMLQGSPHCFHMEDKAQ